MGPSPPRGAGPGNAARMDNRRPRLSHPPCDLLGRRSRRRPLAHGMPSGHPWDVRPATRGSNSPRVRSGAPGWESGSGAGPLIRGRVSPDTGVHLRGNSSVAAPTAQEPEGCGWCGRGRSPVNPLQDGGAFCLAGRHLRRRTGPMGGDPACRFAVPRPPPPCSRALKARREKHLRTRPPRL